MWHGAARAKGWAFVYAALARQCRSLHSCAAACEVVPSNGLIPHLSRMSQDQPTLTMSNYLTQYQHLVESAVGEAMGALMTDRAARNIVTRGALLKRIRSEAG